MSDMKNIMKILTLRMEKKGGNLENAGIILGFLGSVTAILQSSIVVAYSVAIDKFGRYGIVGLGISILTFAGALIVYKGYRPFGAMIMFFSSLIGQLIGGAIGFILATLTSPLRTVYNMDFLVSGWIVFSLIGSILILFALGRSKRI